MEEDQRITWLRDYTQKLEQEKNSTHEKFQTFTTLYLQSGFDLDPYLQELKSTTSLHKKIVNFFNSYKFRQLDRVTYLDEFRDSRQALDRKYHQLQHHIQAGNVNLLILLEMYKQLNKAVSNLTFTIASQRAKHYSPATLAQALGFS